MAGPSRNAFPGEDVFPGEWPPVYHGPTHVLVNDNTSRVLLVTFGEEELTPMSVFEIKRGDSWRPIEAVLMGAEGPIDLTDATEVRLKLRSDSRIVLTGAVDRLDRPGGKVSYQWSRGDDSTPGDLDQVGRYRAEFEIEWDTGDLQTVPNNDYFWVVVYDDLEPR